MNRKALLIGCNYTNVPAVTLRGCIDDIVNMSNMLKSAYNYAPADITMLRDDVQNPFTLPTYNNIVYQLNQIVKDSAGCSEIWIHYSGHGLQVEEKNIKTQKIGIDDAIAPMDYQTAGFIDDNIIYNIIKNIHCRAFLIFDCCHSATVCSLPWLFQYMSGNTFTRTNINHNVINNPAIYMFSGCKDNQTSADTYDTKLKEYVGAMTESFLTSLEDNNYEGSILKIYTDAYRYLENNGYSQRPCFSSSANSPHYTLVNPHVSKPVHATIAPSSSKPTNTMANNPSRSSSTISMPNFKNINTPETKGIQSLAIIQKTNNNAIYETKDSINALAPNKTNRGPVKGSSTINSFIPNFSKGSVKPISKTINFLQ